MLKLTNSFCRYLTLTCENIHKIDRYIHYNKTHVKSFTNLARKPPNVETLFNSPFTYIAQPLRLLANIKKRSRLKKILLYANESKKTKQMSESLQPTLSHVSYGGQFDV